jgi:intein-encoded DNA endonuclease-like protein
MTARTYSDDQLRDFHQEYLAYQNLSLVSFAKKAGLISSALRAGFKRLKLEIIPQSVTHRKFPINENFFESIDTEEKAYYLGFCYADGCNTPSKNRLEVSLAKQDQDILEKLSRTLLCGNLNIKEYKSKKKNTQDKIALYIINEKISQDLFKWGCVNKKTFVLKFPDISEDLQFHFIRGYFDGDGSLTINYRKFNGSSKETMVAYFSIVSTKEMLDKIGAFVSDLGVHFEINKRHKKRDNNNFTLRISGNKQIKKVCDFLYRDANVWLDRKHDNYLRLTRQQEI